MYGELVGVGDQAANISGGASRCVLGANDSWQEERKRVDGRWRCEESLTTGRKGPRAEAGALGETEERVIGASVNKQPTFEVRSLLVVGSAPLAVSLLSQSTFSFAIRHPPALSLSLSPRTSLRALSSDWHGFFGVNIVSLSLLLRALAVGDIPFLTIPSLISGRHKSGTDRLR